MSSRAHPIASAAVPAVALVLLAGVSIAPLPSAGGDPALPATVAGADCVSERRLLHGARMAPTSRWFDAVVSVEVDHPVVALGIDDGPDPRWTPVALEVLERHGARATFFVVGSAAREHPGLLRAIRDAGHEVALHTWAHDHLHGRDEGWLRADLVATAEAVRASGVEPVALLRPPRGEQDLVAAEVACEQGVRTVGWTSWVSHLARDGEVPHPGEVLLAHDGRLPRARELSDLEVVLSALADAGLGCVPVGELLDDVGAVPVA